LAAAGGYAPLLAQIRTAPASSPVIYGCVNGTAETLSGSSDLGQGSGAVAWLTGNFTDSGYAAIAQPWAS